MYSVLAVLITAVYCVHLYRKSINRFCRSKKRLDGKTVVITGGTNGMGLQAAIDIAKRGAKVIIASPFLEEGTNAKKEIEAESGSKNVMFKFLDLSSLQSVREFAADINKTEERLDILVNNAGVGTMGDFATPDGMSIIMQINYYGHFLLTLLLLPLLNKTGTPAEKSRIVCLSSVLHLLARSDVTKYNMTGYYWSQFFIYSNSKFSFVLFSRELSKRLRDLNMNVVVNCVDPGLVATDIYNSVYVWFGIVVNFFITLFFKNKREGAQTTLYVALEEESGKVSGQFFKNCKLSRARSLAYDDEKAQTLWNDSIKLVQLSDEELHFALNSPRDNHT